MNPPSKTYFTFSLLEHTRHILETKYQCMKNRFHLTTFIYGNLPKNL